MIAPAHPLPTALDPVVRYRVADGAEPACFIPSLATLLIEQWREKNAEPQDPPPDQTASAKSATQAAGAAGNLQW
jgi:hypothetical protein